MRFLLFAFALLGAAHALAQPVRVSGRVMDKSKRNQVEMAQVISSNGQRVYTDSLGRFSILSNYQDSIYIYYNNRPTTKFPVAKMERPDDFSVSLGVYVSPRVELLPEVKVMAKSYRQDSIENRETYRQAFGYSKGVSTSVSPTGGVGADLGDIINLFRFRYRKNTAAFQKRLIDQEQEKYVQYRFSRNFVTRATGLTGEKLDEFMGLYTPSYEFIAACDELQLTEYTVRAFRYFQRGGR